MDNKHVFASITSRQNERGINFDMYFLVNLEGEYLKKIMHPADPIDQNDKMYYEEENERQYYSPDRDIIFI